MGKSSLVKAAPSCRERGTWRCSTLKLIEIHREDIESLPKLMSVQIRRGALPLHRLLR
jgi:predicted AAA+ superfamily ATPase